MDKYIGKRLDGRFEIQKLIGTGGMADVYRARDLKDKSIVAVKILKKENSENEEFLRRFRNESLAIAYLSNQNIVKIIDVGFSNKVQYIVMEYIEGITLKKYMELQDAMDWQTSVYFMLQILSALGHAHRRGIVHRDIKPQNIMVLESGLIKVMDFGIAKFAREEGLTTTAQAIGSVHYISPEQARSDVTDEKSDIYSAGIVFYEMLTGVKPFDNENPISVALMHMQQKAKRPTDIRHDIPQELERIIMKAIEKNPEDRYADAQQMINDIENFKKQPDGKFGHDEEEKVYVMERDNKPKRIYDSVDDDSLLNSSYDDADTSYDSDYDSYQDEEPVIEEEYVEKRSMFIPMLSGVVIVVIIIATIFLSGLMLNYFGNESDYREFHVLDFKGQEFDNAKKLYGQYLSFEVKDTVYSPMPANTILDQDLAVDEVVKPGHKIYVVLSKGPRMIEIPSLDNGFTEAQAKSILEEKKFTTQTKLVYSDTVQENYVVKTEPEANTPCKEGTTVLIYISRGKMTQKVKIPDVTGKKEADARKILEETGLEVVSQQRNSAMAEGTVVAIDRSANTVVETGTPITIFISTGQPAVSTQEILINFPKEANGVFTFKVYVDGTLNGEHKDVDAKFTSSKNIAIQGSGTKKEIRIMLVNQANGKEHELGRYMYSFDETMTKQVISEDINAAFKEVGGLKAGAQAAASATPVPTATPAPTPVPTQAPEEPETDENETPEEPDSDGQDENQD